MKMGELTVPNAGNHAEWNRESTVRPLCVGEITSSKDEPASKTVWFVSERLTDSLKVKINSP